MDSIQLSAVQRACVAVGALCALAVFAAPASAETLRVPAQFDTIQEAVDAAQPGDEITVKDRQRRYNENVVVTTNRLEIRGVEGRPVVDGFDFMNTSKPSFDIDANRVTLRRIDAYHGGGIDCTGKRCKIDNVKVRGLVNGDCVTADGPLARVTDSRFVACGDNAVELDGSFGRILRNDAAMIDSDCYQTDGDEMRFVGNSSRKCEDGEGLDHSGDNAEIKRNAVYRTDNDAYEVNGNRNVIARNFATENDQFCFEVDGNDVGFVRNVGDTCDDGTDVDGNRARVLRNTLAQSADDCLEVLGDDVRVEENRLDGCFKGLEVRGENPRVIDNRIDRVHTDDGIDLSCFDDGSGGSACRDGVLAGNRVLTGGDDDETINVDVSSDLDGFVIRDNLAKGGLGDGFEISMSDGRIEGNRARFNGSEEEPGFQLFGSSNKIIGNVAFHSGGEGFQLSNGNGNVFRGNLARGNHQDGLFISGGIGGTVLVRNEALNNLGDGIENDGNNTVVRRNVSRSNGKVDCANDGTIAERQGNRCGDGSNFNEPSSGLG